MDDRTRVEELIGRPPQSAFDVVVRDAAGDPVVLRNAPFLDDGTPMPTRYYLVGADIVRAVSRLEAAGGVKAAEADVDPADIAAAHAAYAAERDAAISTDHTGPRPSGGVGGTRQGVKCLHAHVAHVLAGGDDSVGRWALARLGNDRELLDELQPPVQAPGSLTLAIHDHLVAISMTGGGTWQIPLGPVSLHERELVNDPPQPADLTNALGFIHDYFDDIVGAAPMVLAAPGVRATGTHARSLAHVEIGGTTIPAGYAIRRADADELFRTLVAEPRSDRLHNPGLDPAHVDTIIATLCIVLAIMRRLDLGDIAIDAGGQ